jgi:hypothetical protein
LRGLRAALVAWTLLAGCAHSQRSAGFTTWTFPRGYRAVQVVSVALPDGPREFLASVIRTGRRVEVVLFEPALMVPLVSASGGDGPATEKVHLEGVPPGQGLRLVRLLTSMHSTVFEARADGSASGARDGFRFGLEAFETAPGCRFPGVIEVELPLGGPTLRVRTTDFACDDPGATGSVP